MGSNGLTSARHDVFGKYLAEKYSESYDPAVPKDLIYSGSVKLTDKVEDSPLDAGKLVSIFLSRSFYLAMVLCVI